jgi:acyl carrier protein
VIDARLRRIWESVLKFAPVSRTDDFFELGGTSLQSIELLLQIEELFGVSLPPSTLAEHGTIEKISALLVDRAVIRSPSPVVKLREGEGRPLFLIHSGQGDVATYGLLTRRLPGRPIYGLQSVGLQGESWPLMSIPEMAQRYLPAILAQDPTGPYLLAGTCMGGMVAFELAQMLRRQGREIGLLGFIETVLPQPKAGSDKWHRRVYTSLRTPIHEHWRMWRWKIIRAAGLGQNDRWLPDYRRFIANINGRAHRHYRPSFYPGEITLFITVDTKFPEPDPRLLARQLAQTTRVMTIPGVRRGLFMKPAVDELARQLQVCLPPMASATA